MLRLMLGLCVLVLPGLANADDSAREQLIQQLEAAATLSADFEQRTYGESELEGRRSSGYMKVARPLKFLWHVTSPFEQQVVSDGETLWIYDPDLLQATHQPVAEQIQRSPAMVLSQPRSTLTDAYDVLRAKGGELTSYRLFPNREDAIFSEMTLLFEDQRIAEIRLKDNLGQTTRVTFSNVKTNITIDPSVFQFDPPEGVDVFEQM